jgi:hypothetical protein
MINKCRLLGICLLGAWNFETPKEAEKDTLVVVVVVCGVLCGMGCGGCRLCVQLCTREAKKRTGTPCVAFLLVFVPLSDHPS